MQAEVLSHVPNLMIWSDNDVANDFTTLKDKNGGQVWSSFFAQF